MLRFFHYRIVEALATFSRKVDLESSGMTKATFITSNIGLLVIQPDSQSVLQQNLAFGTTTSNMDNNRTALTDQSFYFSRGINGHEYLNTDVAIVLPTEAISKAQLMRGNLMILNVTLKKGLHYYEMDSPIVEHL